MDVHTGCLLLQGGRRMGFRCVCDVLHQLVFGGTQTKFVDSCQIQVFHHDCGEASGKGLVGLVMSPFLLF